MINKMKKLIITSVLTATLFTPAYSDPDYVYSPEVRCQAKYVYVADGVEKTYTNTTQGNVKHREVCKGYKKLSKKVGKRLNSKQLGYVGVKGLKCQREEHSGFLWLSHTYKNNWETCSKKFLTEFDTAVNKIVK
jgi:hypothetical protein